VSKVVDPRELLQANLGLIEGIALRTCRRARLRDADADDFVASVKLALVEDDYAILRKYEGRAALATYLTIVIERLLADDRMHRLGRFHASAEATRLGPTAVLLESLVLRDGRSIDEALPAARSADPAITRDAAEALLAKLPQRRPRAVTIGLEDAPERALSSPQSAERALLSAEAGRLLVTAAAIIRSTIASYTLEYRTLVRFRYAMRLTISDISRMMRLPQRPLYRRVEGLLLRLRRELEAAGVPGSSVPDLLERAAEEELDLGLEGKVPMEMTAASQSTDAASDAREHT
jgi:RNA polymerase sigma factor for flagellar operon FliA